MPRTSADLTIKLAHPTNSQLYLVQYVDHIPVYFLSRYARLFSHFRVVQLRRYRNPILQKEIWYVKSYSGWTRTFSVFSKAKGEWNACANLNNFQLLPTQGWTLYQGEVVDFLANVMSTLVRPPFNECPHAIVSLFIPTCPEELPPALHISPFDPTRIEWCLPQAAWTNLVPEDAPKLCGVMQRGANSDISSKVFDGVASADGLLRPNIQAFPSISSTTQWLAQPEECTETALTLLSERRMCGSSKSGLKRSTRSWLRETDDE